MFTDSSGGFNTNHIVSENEEIFAPFHPNNNMIEEN